MATSATVTPASSEGSQYAADPTPMARNSTSTVRNENPVVGNTTRRSTGGRAPGCDVTADSTSAHGAEDATAPTGQSGIPQEGTGGGRSANELF